MKKIINRPEHFVDETMEGIIAAYGDKVRLLNGDKRILLSNYPAREDKVGIVTAGGSGHLPVFLGYVGSGMLDGCAVGNVFASPSAQKMADMIRACDRGRGVLPPPGQHLRPGLERGQDRHPAPAHVRRPRVERHRRDQRGLVEHERQRRVEPAAGL